MISGAKAPPANEEVEQALLGALLVDNSAFERVADFLRPEHFHFPVHARIFETIARAIAQGETCGPVTLKKKFEADGDLTTVGGGDYIAQLAANVVTTLNVGEYGRHLVDLYARRQLLDFCEQTRAAALDLDPTRSARDAIEELEARLYGLADGSPAGRPAPAFAAVMAEVVRAADAARRGDRGARGLPTGLRGVDRQMGGLRAPDLVVLAGRPSMGKTALATGIATHVARAGAPVLIFSMEMSGEQIGGRIAAAAAGIPVDVIRRGDATARQFQDFVDAGQRAANLPLFIDDRPAQTIAQLRTAARRLKRRRGALGLIVVDYIQLIRPDGKHKGENRVQELTEITAGLKGLAKELNVPVLALSQLSRAVEQREDKRPQLADLRDSGSIEQDADIVTFVFREEYYLERAEPARRSSESEAAFNDRYDAWQRAKAEARGRAELIVAKHRNGPTGVVPLRWDGALTTFSDAPPDHSSGRDT